MNLHDYFLWCDVEKGLKALEQLSGIDANKLLNNSILFNSEARNKLIDLQSKVTEFRNQSLDLRIKEFNKYKAIERHNKSAPKITPKITYSGAL